MEIDRFDALHPVDLIFKGQDGHIQGRVRQAGELRGPILWEPVRSKKRRETPS